MNTDDALTAGVIGNTIADFLRDNGGMANGYDTWVSGSITLHDHTLSWYTPDANGLQLGQIKNKTKDLAIRIRAQLADTSYDRVILAKKHIGHGCCDIKIKLVSDAGYVPLHRIERRINNEGG